MRHSIRSLHWFAAALSIAIVFHSPTIAQTPPAEDDRSTSPANRSAVEPFTVRDRLDEGSPTLEDGSYYNTHTFEGIAGQVIAIEMTSDDFDTYLLLRDPNGNTIAQNDDWSGTNSQIAIELPATGSYTLVANSYAAGETGAYTLTLREATANDLVAAEADRLYQQGNQQYRVSQFREAVQSFEQALNLYRQLGDRQGEGRAIGNLGNAYADLGQYQRAIELYEQRLVIAREIGDRQGEGNALNNLGIAYRNLGQYQRAIELYEQVLVIAREIGDRQGEGNAIGNLGIAYNSLGQYQRAIELYEQQLVIAREIGDRQSEGYALSNLGLVYRNIEQYQQAIELSQQVLVIARDIGDRPGEGNALGNLGVIYRRLGQYQQAINFFEQSLVIMREIGNREGEGNALGNLGSAYLSLKQYQQATNFFEQSLVIMREIGNRDGEGAVLNNLGITYAELEQHQLAINLFEQQLIIAREISDPHREGTVLNNLGRAYNNLRQYQRAINFYQQALSISQAIGDRSTEGITLSNIGELLAQQDQPELAIAFLKQSVNVRESIRGEIRGLDQELQQSYTDTVADDYRQLADLLLSQGRILEAQQVLDLLKLEELSEFTRNAGNIKATEGIRLNETEQQILDEYGSLVAFGQSVLVCEQTNCGQLEQLRAQQRDLADAYDRRVTELIADIRDNRANDDFFYDPRYLNETAREIVAEPGTVLVYPFVQDDKLWILWTASGEIVGSTAIDLPQDQLGETVVRFRQLLQDPRSNVAELQATGKQLYDWLIAPIETELEAREQSIEHLEIKHLVFAQDRILRYLPMAALFDGEQYLIQRYRVSTILSAELTDMGDRLAPRTSDNAVLAVGLSDSVNGLDPLTNVEVELDAIVQVGDDDPAGVFPGLTFFNEAFTLPALEQNLRNSRIVHIATHGKFVAGQPEQSYLVMGNGDPLTIQQIDRLGSDLRDVNLVVLSACETALGGSDADGIEVAGISSYFLAANRATTVLASLWLVNDASTSTLMQQFYRNLAGGMTKAEALRQAQRSLLGETESVAGADRTGDGTITIVDARTGQPYLAGDISHPYYWAPFILIGNGL